MKANFSALALLAVSVPFTVSASTYLDVTGDSSTVASLDITSVVVNNDATTLSSVGLGMLLLAWHAKQRKV